MLRRGSRLTEKRTPKAFGEQAGWQARISIPRKTDRINRIFRIPEFDEARAHFLILSLVAPSAFGAERGIIGVSVQGTPDFRVIASVVPDGPAARADIRVGDQIVAIGNVPASKIQTVQEFLRKVFGPSGSEIELRVKRPQTDSLIRVRRRRVAPATLEPPKIPADFERYQTRNHVNDLTRRSS
jgi:predicted metalloprotease with PDZ domain